MLLNVRGQCRETRGDRKINRTQSDRVTRETGS